MSYHLDNSPYSRYGGKKRPGFRWLLILAVVVLLLLGGELLFKLDSYASQVSYPSWKVRNEIGDLTALVPALTVSKATLIEQNRQLQQKVDRLSLALEQTNLLKSENKALRQITDSPSGDFKPLLAKVITKPYQTPYDVIIIDLGQKDSPKLKEGNSVMAEGVLLGTVIEVGEKTSKVKLFSSPGIVTPIIFDPSGVSALARGYGGGNFVAKLPKGVEVGDNESVVLASSTTSIIGQVALVEADPNDPYQTIRFRSPVNIFRLLWVEIYES